MIRKINTLRKLALAIVGMGVTVVPSFAMARDHDDWRHDRNDRADVRVDLNFGRNDFHFGFVRPEPDCTPVAPVVREPVQRVWVEPVYQTVCDKAWVEPVTQDVCQRVWVDAVYQDQQVVRYEGRRRYVSVEHVLVSPGHYEDQHQTVIVTPGHYEDVQRQVLVTPGHWEDRVVYAR